ncbi:DUF4097 family beta strand repeat-containing protein [Streptomyces malaysiense]|uniref:DUF4097 domain-containing protein n=1 Tax=Streptomyces malaysiense TaxID=1428626 RepID=A0A1J4Q6A0_9ACTN|nr:DUF4097 family beta strand repeat-containing protein [Streptomyces malaysiense]OIK27616.1 hypothetical protein VT52_010000 [Streptomyces malaysiense]
MRRARFLAAAALAALTVGGLSACSILDQKSFEDDAKVSQKVTSIRLDSGNGDVKVESAADASAVSVHRKVNYHGDKPSRATFHVDNGVLTLSGCGPDCAVDYDVKVPAGLPVTGGTSNGDLTLNDAGAIDVHTSNGDIAVHDAAGAVKLRTSNGDVHVQNTKGGAIDTRTSNGTVTIRTATPGNIKAHTTSGDLTITVPPAKYRISAHDTNGDKTLAFKDDPSGRYLLDLSTTNGNLTVESAG